MIAHALGRLPLGPAIHRAHLPIARRAALRPHASGGGSGARAAPRRPRLVVDEGSYVYADCYLDDDEPVYGGGGDSSGGGGSSREQVRAGMDLANFLFPPARLPEGREARPAPTRTLANSARTLAPSRTLTSPGAEESWGHLALLRASLQGELSEEEAMALALEQSACDAVRRECTQRSVGGSEYEDDGGLALALALSARDVTIPPNGSGGDGYGSSTDSNGDDAASWSDAPWPRSADGLRAARSAAEEEGAAAKASRPHLTPLDMWGELSEDEALELALALSQAEAEAEEAEAEEAGGGVSPPPPQRAPLLPPGLSVPPGLAMLPSRLPVVPHLAEHSGTQGGPAGLGASAASAPLDFAGWANCALEACTGHDDNVQLIEFMLGFSSLDDEIEYLGESVGASRGLQDEWLAHRLSEEP